METSSVLAEPVELVAIDPARNIRRRYRITVARDLFGHVLVETSWGRIGRAGQSCTYSFPDETRAAAFVRTTLRRRAGAPKRIGVAYCARC